MDKIVIVTGQPQPNSRLLELVNAFFPDCEINIVLKGNETDEQRLEDSFSWPLAADKIGRR